MDKEVKVCSKRRKTDSDKRATRRERNKRYSQKTSSIQVPVEVTEELRRIGNEEGFSSDRDIISYLISVYNNKAREEHSRISKEFRSHSKDVAVQTDDEPVQGQTKDQEELVQEIDGGKCLPGFADGELEQTHWLSNDKNQGISYLKEERKDECVTPGADGSKYYMSQLLTLEGQTFTIKHEVDEDLTGEEQEEDQCTKQGTEFEYEEDEKHMIEYSKEKTHQCSHRSEEFIDENSLILHQKSPDGECDPSSQEKTYQCSHCSEEFIDENSLILHQKSPDGECDPSSHPRINSGERYCDEKFDSIEILLTHQRTHNGEIPYLCSYCEKEFSEMTDLIYHIRTHTKEKPFLCSLCEKTFSSTARLNRHIMAHTKEKSYHCSYCEKEFSYKSSLNRHIRTHIKCFQCSECSKRFSQRMYLICHMRKHTKEKSYHCEKRFSNKVDLESHTMTHTSERNHPCPHCEEIFHSKIDLARHIRTRDGQKPYPCPKCWKRFCCKNDLSRHLRTHDGLLSWLTNLENTLEG